MRTLCLLVLAHTLLCAQTTAERIDAILKSSSSGRRGVWGMQVVNLTSGETLFEFQQDRFFMPASTAKLFSTALALDRLGPGYRFVTTVAAGNAPNTTGIIAGDLRLIGGGDPTLSGRPVPYRKGAAPGNPLDAIEELADQIVARGVRRIEGDIVGDDTAYEWEPLPNGWAQDDALWSFGAPVSALAIGENRISLTLSPGRKAGDPAVLRLSPPLEYMLIDNRVRTVSGGEASLHMERTPGSRQIRLWGALPLRGGAVSRLLAVGDPAEFAEAALSEALTRRGVVVSGRPVARHRFRLDNM